MLGIPTLGPKVPKDCVVWAIWILRDLGSTPQSMDRAVAPLLPVKAFHVLLVPVMKDVANSGKYLDLQTTQNDGPSCEGKGTAILEQLEYDLRINQNIICSLYNPYSICFRMLAYMGHSFGHFGGPGSGRRDPLDLMFR